MRPDQLANIKPNHATRRQESFRPGQGLRAGVAPYPADRVRADQAGQHEERHQPQPIAPMPPTIRPPSAETEHDGQDHGRWLAGHGERSKQHRERVIPFLRTGIEFATGPAPPEEKQDRQQIEETGLGVFQFCDPGHRFDLDRMQGP